MSLGGQPGEGQVAPGALTLTAIAPESPVVAARTGDDTLDAVDARPTQLRDDRTVQIQMRLAARPCYDDPGLARPRHLPGDILVDFVAAEADCRTEPGPQGLALQAGDRTRHDPGSDTAPAGVNGGEVVGAGDYDRYAVGCRHREGEIGPLGDQRVGFAAVARARLGVAIAMYLAAAGELEPVAAGREERFGAGTRGAAADETYLDPPVTVRRHPVRSIGHRCREFHGSG